MPLNTLALTTLFQQALDAQLVAEATSGWMEANAGQVIYNGGKDIKIPRISMDGLGDYDRDDGFVQGSVTLDYETLTMTQDRGRTFQLDAMDVNETNFVANASRVMAEFQRTKVVPEIDAYRYSKIYALAAAKNRVNAAGYTPVAADILAKLKADLAAIEDVVGNGYQFVITMNALCASVLDQADKVEKVLNVVDFARGNVSTKVKAIDENPIIKVPSARMKTAYTLYDGTTEGQKGGGFVPAAGAKQINWIITLRSAPIAVSKTDKTRIFTPDTNQKADAWKIDYRKYHELWVPEHRLQAVMANVGV
ncbi:MAG TPA: hypothetical protein PKB13_09885 [Clostridia bacterium]|nr:hypothetical protein [Clostridia bacterium]